MFISILSGALSLPPVFPFFHEIQVLKSVSLTYISCLDRTFARTDWSQGTYSLDTLKGWLERLLRLNVVAVDVCGGLSPAQGAKPQDLRVNGETDVELQEWILTCLER